VAISNLKRELILAVMLSCSNTSEAADSFFCTQEAISGFVFKAGDWIATSMKPDGRKLIIRQPEKEDEFYGKLAYIILDASSREPASYCPQYEQHGFLMCDMDTFVLYIETGRYYILDASQLLTDKSSILSRGLSPTPNIEIGQCTKVES